MTDLIVYWNLEYGGEYRGISEHPGMALVYRDPISAVAAAKKILREGILRDREGSWSFESGRPFDVPPDPRQSFEWRQDEPYVTLAHPREEELYSWIDPEGSGACVTLSVPHSYRIVTEIETIKQVEVDGEIYSRKVSEKVYGEWTPGRSSTHRWNIYAYRQELRFAPGEG